MQRVSALLPAWERNRAASLSDTKPKGLTKVWGWADKLASPRGLSITTTNAAAPSAGSKVGREVYWPTTLDRECDKAARILKSFCSTHWCLPHAYMIPTYAAL